MNHQLEIVRIYADWASIKQGKILGFFFWLFSVHCSYLDALGKLRHPKQLEKKLKNTTKSQKVTERMIWKIATSEVKGSRQRSCWELLCGLSTDSQFAV